MFSYASLVTEHPVNSAVFTAQDTMPDETHGRTLYVHHALHAMANETQSKTEDEKLRLARSVWHELPADSHAFWTHRASTARLARDRLDFLLTDGSTRLSKHHQSLVSQDLMNNARLQLRNIGAAEPREQALAPRSVATAMHSELARLPSFNEENSRTAAQPYVVEGSGREKTIKVESRDRSTQADALNVAEQSVCERTIKLEGGRRSPQPDALITAEQPIPETHIKLERDEESTQADAGGTAQQPAREGYIKDEPWERPLSILSARNDGPRNDHGSDSLESRKRKLRHDGDSSDDEVTFRHGLDPNNRDLDGNVHDDADTNMITPALELPEPLVIPPGTNFAEIERAHAKLHRRNPEWAATFASMFKEPVAESGRTLFIYHVEHVLGNEFQANGLCAEDVWATQDEASRGWWADQTSKAMTGCGENRYIGFVSHNHEKKITRRLEERARTVLSETGESTDHSRDVQEEEKKTNSSDNSSDEWTAALVLRHLTGAPSVGAALTITSDELANCIQRKIDEHPNMICRGRGFSLIRLDYNPKCKGPAGIQSWWAHTQATDNNIASLEALLRPWVIWNKRVFPGLKEAVEADVDGVENSCEPGRKAFASQWHWHQDTERLLVSPKGYDPDQVIQALVLQMRRRCEKVDPTSILLQNPEQVVGHHEWNSNKYGFLKKRLQDWSLFDVKRGFGAQVARVFDEKGLNATQYAERVERRLQAFRVANPTAVHGHPK